MLGYISSTRKKSCQACVKAKRRCDLGYPICKRCLTKGLHCKYPNASVCNAEVVVRQTTPDLTLAEVIVNGSSDLNPDDSTLDPIFSQFNDLSQSNVITKHVLPPTILESLLPQIWEPRILNQQQVSRIVNELCHIVPTMALTGKTMFMHRELYKDFQPTAYQDLCGLSALYTVKTSKNIPILAASIDAKISALMASSSTWCLTEHLAAVQALMIYQIIRLFDPSLQLQAVADKQNSLLELWTATLWKRSFNEADPFNNDCYISWAFQESLRRTVLMSVFMRGAWCALTNNGLCEQVPIMGRLPLTREIKLFESSAEEWAQNTPCTDPRSGLIAYGDLSVTWTHDSDPDGLDDFERILLAACRGDDDPRLLEFPPKGGSDTGSHDGML
ncbi:hypothetical protein K491DRAFT_259518 [Lophiostoma macrostomum CBS 122681]|uniref:Zn(2)-C6 fungal-type domain-containing protein n=1 Tax=Lophiostoma macrostomum CBS 122681 TaxID=1314788 RepID=A0A6A6TF97_9PLEO|nr:hypothetical protein K491DRAFT_259518 [Lophiostoma macrostomum CBS 122681]